MSSDERTEPKPVRTWATTALLALNIGVAFSMAAGGASILLPSPEALVVFGGVDASRVWDGEVWRLLTGTFVHFGLWHIGLNLWVLTQVGRTLERFVGTSRFLLIYLVSGVFGFALSVLLRPGLAVGASGAIFGATGGLLAIAGIVRHGPLGRFLFAALLPFVGATLVIGFLLPFIDNSAHVGGLAMGFLLGYGLTAGERSFLVANGEEAPPAQRGERRLGTLSLVAAVALFAVVVPLSLRPTISAAYLVQEGLEALAREEEAEARRLLARAERLAPRDPAVMVLAARVAQESDAPDAQAQASALFASALEATGEDPGPALARLLVEIGSPADAMAFSDPRTGAALCHEALRLQGDRPDPLLKNNCAWLLLKTPDERLRDPARALALAERAVLESRRAEPTILHTLAEAHAQNGDPREAENLLARMMAEGLGQGAFYREERARFRKLADEADRARAAEEGPAAP